MDQSMAAALEDARTGAAEGGIPIGAALVDGQGRLVATGRNHRIQDRAVVMHDEINCYWARARTWNTSRAYHLLNTHALQHVRWGSCPVRHHQGSRGRVRELPRKKRTEIAAEARSRGR